MPTTSPASIPPMPINEFSRAHGRRWSWEDQDIDDLAILSRVRRVIAALDGIHEPLDQPTAALVLRSPESLAAAWALLAAALTPALVVHDGADTSWLIRPIHGVLTARQILRTDYDDLIELDNHQIKLHELIATHGPVRLTEWNGASGRYASEADQGRTAFPEVSPADEIATRINAALRSHAGTASALTQDGVVTVYSNLTDEVPQDWTHDTIELLSRHGIAAEPETDPTIGNEVRVPPAAIAAATGAPVRIYATWQLLLLPDQSVVWSKPRNTVGQITHHHADSTAEHAIAWLGGTTEQLTDVDLPVYVLPQPWATPNPAPEATR